MSTTKANRNGIILSMFGTSVAEGLPGLLHIRDRMAKKFPKATVRMAFTSQILRRIWQERAADPEYRPKHPHVPNDILEIRSPAEVVKSYADIGVEHLVLQPVHIAPVTKDRFSKILQAEIEASDGKSSISLFQKTAVGRPALGILDHSFSYKNDIAKVVNSLARDMDRARKEKAAIFYMGHGNKEPATQRVYDELVAEIRQQYPDVLTVMSMVEGDGCFRGITRELHNYNVDKVILKPFMVVAGNHVRKDMLGEGAGTLYTLLVNEGIHVIPVTTGLGENNAFAEVFVDHAADAAQEAGIELG